MKSSTQLEGETQAFLWANYAAFIVLKPRVSGWDKFHWENSPFIPPQLGGTIHSSLAKVRRRIATLLSLHWQERIKQTRDFSTPLRMKFNMWGYRISRALIFSPQLDNKQKKRYKLITFCFLRRLLFFLRHLLLLRREWIAFLTKFI